MRACNAEEGNSHCDSDPWEVFTQLSILIVEGRTPGGEKGYHAGPHCTLPHQAGGNRHLCDPSSSTCIKVESLLRQLRLMWGVGVGVSVEVLVAPECEHGAALANTTLDAATAPSPLLRLIEQWNFSIFDRNIPDATSNGWSLLAAVRSFLHFSQLSAWLSVSGGSRPPYILYRLTVTSPVFCSKFESGSEEHTFPIANLGQETAIKVIVRSVPRSSQVPVVFCLEHHDKQSNLPIDDSSSVSSIHNKHSSSMSIDFSQPAMAACQLPIDNKSEGSKSEEDLRRCMMRARLGEPVRIDRSQSPDTQLGESLLDPPNSLARIPRRYQSPSRSGSPSLETPEHIICRVRTPGPSPGRPPDVGNFFQPLVIPTRPPMNLFSWTQSRYPSMQPSYPIHFNSQSIHSEMFHPSAVPSTPLPVGHYHHQYSQNGPTFVPNCPSNSQPFYSSSQHYNWSLQQQDISVSREISVQSYAPSHPTHLYHLIQKPEPVQSLQLLNDKNNASYEPDCGQQYYQHKKNEPYHSEPFINQFSFIQPEDKSLSSASSVVETSESISSVAKLEPNKKTIEDQDGEGTAGVSSVISRYDANCALAKGNCITTSDTDEEGNSCSGTKTKVQENQGTKRKGACSKESPRKRESPPHIYLLKDGSLFCEVVEDRRRNSVDGEDLMKRKNDCDDDHFAKKYSPMKKEMVNDQLWPRCSQQGKHLCSSIEDLAEIHSEEATVFSTLNKSLKCKKKSSCSKLEDSNVGKVSFDLTPKETQEILNVLRQNTPVPPLRIGQHRPSGRASANSNGSELITIEQGSKGLKIRRSSQEFKESAISKLNTLCNPASKYMKETCFPQSEIKSLRCHTSDLKSKSGHRKIQEGGSVNSSNKPCDTSFKKPSNCTCNKNLKNEKSTKNGNHIMDIESEDDDDGVIEDGLSSMELEKLRSTEVIKKSNCVEAKTVTQKTSFFTVSSQPTSKAKETFRQTSQTLMRSPLSSVLSSIKSVTLHCNQNESRDEGRQNVRRVLKFEEAKDNASNNGTPLASTSSYSANILTQVGREATYDELSKGVNLLKDLMKKGFLSTQEKLGLTEDTETSIKTLKEDLPIRENDSVEKENCYQNIVCSENVQCFQNGHVKSEQESTEKSSVSSSYIEGETSSNEEDDEVEDLCRAKGIAIPSTSEKVKFRRSLDSAATLVFHNKTGLPLTSSPAPLRKGTCFDFDSSLNSVAAIKSAFRTCESVDEDCDTLIKEDAENIRPSVRSVHSASAPTTVTCSNLLGSFEECVLNGRLEPVSTVQGFSAEIAASGSFCPKHTNKSVTVFFYTLCDNDQISSPYMGHINLGKKGYHIPKQGTVQVTLFNPHGTVVKMFVVMYDLADMPPNSKTFLRQRTLNMPVGATDNHPDAHQWLRYLIHLRFASSKSGKIYLHTDIRMLIFRKSDADAATMHKNSVPFELRSFTHGPTNPKFSPRK